MRPIVSTPSRRLRGFTLLELLIVVGIMALLIAFALPAVGSLLSASRRGRVPAEIVNLLEIARSEAMSRQRLTWVGFEQGTTDTGEQELRAVVMTLPGGKLQTTFAGGGLVITTAAPVTPTHRWKDIELVPRSSLTELAPLLSGVDSSTSLPTQARQTFRFGDSSQPRLTFYTVTFTPQGYALLNARPDLMTPYADQIDIGLRPTLNTGATEDQMLVLLNGFSGQTQIFRH